MSTTDQFLLALQAYQEIREELRLQEEPVLRPIPPAGRDFPAVDETLLIGLGDDGLPITLNLKDPSMGPILVAGDGGCGKTALLQTLAVNSDSMPDVQFGVVTPFPEEWRGHEALPNCLGIWPAFHPSAGGFLAQLTNWAEVLPKTRQQILLFVDGFDLMNLDSTSRYHLLWMLTHGPENHVWPIVAINPSRARSLQSFMAYFQTRIMGHVRRYQTACQLTSEPPLDLGGLIPGTQFFYTFQQDCLRFWLPPTEGVSYERGNALVR